MSQSTQPMFAEALQSDGRRRQVARASTVHAVIVCLTAAAVALIAPPFIRLALPAAYGQSSEYLPWMALGFAFYGLYLIPMNAISVMAGRTERVWMITLFAAACNIGVNLIFVPEVGPIAAAISTAIGYAVLLVGVSAYMTRVVTEPIPFEHGRLAIGVALILGATLIAMAISPREAWAAFVVGLGAVTITGVIVVRIMFRREFAMAAGMLRSGAGTGSP
jgi:O-antigen/teichoic acid export membrane protein